MTQNKSKKFINFWEFLGLPMHSPLASIKLAYYQKFMEIEKSLDNGETTYTANDLIIANQAYETLSDPYKRFLHNCEIDDETPDLPDFDIEEARKVDLEQDLSDDENGAFLSWLSSKTDEYYNLSKNNGLFANNGITWNIELEVYKEIAIGLTKNHMKLQEQLKKKQTQKKSLNK